MIAHSFGTYLVASALELYDEIEFDRIIFCGSIVHTAFAWSRVLDTGRVRRVLHNCGQRDIWVKIASWVIQDAGVSGVTGFNDTAGGRVIERKHRRFRHSGYLYRLNYQRNWIPFLNGGEPMDQAALVGRPANWKFRLVVILFLTLATLAGWALWRS